MGNSINIGIATMHDVKRYYFLCIGNIHKRCCIRTSILIGCDRATDGSPVHSTNVK